MKNKGEIKIGFLGALFLIVVVMVLLGKIGFWHILLFPIYAIIGTIGMVIGGVAALIFLCWLAVMFLK